MKIDKKVLPKNQLEITAELSVEELKPFIDATIEEIGKTKTIKGFRPGKAPSELVVNSVGEMKIYQYAANDAIAKTYYDFLEQEKLDTVDQPSIEVVKLAPGNPFIFKAVVSLLPKVELCDYAKLEVKALPEIKIEEADVDKVLEDLRKMRAKEVLEDKAAETGNKIELDFNTYIDSVPIEGGQAQKHWVIIGEQHMIPGFEEALVGLKKDDEKEFELSFPKNYHKKRIAGQKATFKVKIHGVYRIELPELNEEFARGFGMKDFENLRKNISSNLKREKETRETQKQELEIIEKLIENCKFEEIPEVLITDETHKMFHELEDNILNQGMKMEDYLTHLKKTEAELRLDFVPDAIKRVKTALAIRSIAKKEKLEVTHDEIHEETDKIIASYKLNPAYADEVARMEQNLHSEETHRYITNIIMNRKTLAKLKELVVKA
jgi:trigger factor